MTDDRIRPPEEELEEVQPDIDRRRSSVAKKRSSPIGTIAIFGTAAVAIVLVLLDDLTGKDDDPLKKEPVQFSTGVNATGLPAFKENQPPPKFEQPKTSTQPIYVDNKDAQRKAEARQEARRKSQIVIFDQSQQQRQIARGPAFANNRAFADRSRPAPGQIVPVASPGNFGGVGPVSAAGFGQDRNQAFLNRIEAQPTQTVHATALRNLENVIAEGTMISAVLETAIQSDLPGRVRAVVSEPIYSYDGQRTVVPKGARLVGQYRSGLVTGEARLFVIWTRMLRPDGATITLNSPGTDALGRAGLGGKVDTHFLERFGAAALLSLIDAGVDAAVSNDSSTVAIETGRDFERAAEIALRNQINIPPTIRVHQGKRIKVFVARDLDFTSVDG